MGVEIERKFLLKGDEWRKLADGTRYCQGYLSTVKERSVRVRTINDRAWLTIKGISQGVRRLEFQYEIPYSEACELLEKVCEQPLIDKKRFRILYQGFIWEVDEFYGANQGLILAEVELKSEEQFFSKPHWIGEEVSSDPRYFNASLIAHPCSQW